MPEFYFLAGNTPELSYLELASFHYPVKKHQANLLALDIFSQDEAKQIFQVLGGFTKLYQNIFTTQDLQSIPEFIITYLKSISQKIDFSLYSTINDYEFSPAKIKTLLIKQGVKARYLQSNNISLPAALFLHHPDIVELTLIKIENSFSILKTLAVQDIDQWTIKDRAKPFAEKQRGMLPPKIARIMLNLALQNHSRDKMMKVNKVNFYDPFCGTGTIALEALELNCQTFASDLDIKAVTGTNKNLTWFCEKFSIKTKYHVFHQDVTQLKKTDLIEPIDIVVTEPFLGKLTPSENAVKNIFKGLEKLYLGTFKKLSNILRDQATICIIFPFFQGKNQVYNFEKLIDKLSHLGYTLQVKPVLYHREHAIIQRQIHLFKFNH